MKYYKHLALILLTLFLLQSCGQDPTGPDYSNVPAPYDTTSAVSSTTSEDGLKIYVIEEGYGAFEVVSRDQVRIRFTGRTADGRIFDSSYANGFSTPRTFRNLTPVPINDGFSQISPLIDGFRRGLLGMRQGEKRTVVIPPELGYGESREGTNGFDLRNDTLIFDIELVEILSLQ